MAEFSGTKRTCCLIGRSSLNRKLANPISCGLDWFPVDSTRKRKSLLNPTVTAAMSPATSSTPHALPNVEAPASVPASPQSAKASSLVSGANLQQAVIPQVPSRPMATASDAIRRAEAALADCSHLVGSDLRIDGSHELITLAGEVRSYFHKQLAQEAVLRLAGIKEVRNELRVRPRRG